MANKNHVISVDLRLNSSNFTGEVKTFQTQLKGMFSNNALQTGAWVNAFGTIQNAGVKAFGAIGSQIKSAMDYQTTLISQAGNLSNVFKTSYNDGLKLAKAFNVADAKNNLGLPFADLRNTLRSQIGDDFLSAFGNTQKGIEKATELLGSTALILGSTDGVTNFQRTNAAQSFLSAPNAKALQRQEVFRNNPAIMRAFNDVEASGLKFNGLGRDGRVEFWKQLADRVATPELKGRFSNTLANGFGNFKASLFNEEIGLLSFTRELNPGKVNTSVIGALTELFTSATKVDGSGFKTFADSLLSFGVGGINSFTNALKSGFSGGLLKGAGAVGTGVFEGIKVGLSGIATAASSVLIPIDFLLQKFGIMTPAIQSVTAGFTALLVVAGAKIGVSWIAGMTTSLIALSGVGWTAITGGFALLTTGMAYATAGVAALNAGLLGFLVNPVVLGGAAVVTAIAVAGLLVWKYWQPLSQVVSAFFNGLVSGIGTANPLIKSFQSALSSLGGVVSGIGGAFNSMVGGINNAIGAMKNFLGVQSQVNASGGVVKAATSAGAAVGRGLTPSWKNFIPGYGIAKTLGLTGNFAGGNDLGKALARESVMKPTGSATQLAVINSSEAILNRKQQEQIRGRETVTIAPVFNITGSNAEEIAYMIENNLERILNNVYQKRTLGTA